MATGGYPHLSNTYKPHDLAANAVTGGSVTEMMERSRKVQRMFSDYEAGTGAVGAQGLPSFELDDMKCFLRVMFRDQVHRRSNDEDESSSGSDSSEDDENGL